MTSNSKTSFWGRIRSRLAKKIRRLRQSGRKPAAPLPIIDGWEQSSALFMLSTGRSGTDTAHRLYSLSAQILALHEPAPRLAQERKQAFLGVHSDPARFESIFRTNRAGLVSTAVQQSKAYVETSARMTFFAPVIERVMPNARFLFLHRHPADVVRSGMRRGWYVDHVDDRDRIVPAPDSVAGQAWSGWSQFEKICWYWDAYNRFALDWIDSLAPEQVARVLTLGSNDLFHADERTSAALFGLVDRQPPPAEVVAECLGTKHNAQHGGDFPQIKAWSAHERRILWSTVGETAARLGYEQ